MYFSFYLTNDAYNYIMNFFQYIDSKKKRVFHGFHTPCSISVSYFPYIL